MSMGLWLEPRLLVAVNDATSEVSVAELRDVFDGSYWAEDTEHDIYFLHHPDKGELAAARDEKGPRPGDVWRAVPPETEEWNRHVTATGRYEETV